ncbi:MAG: alpha/beta hydrolase [Ginsengibacter sp.]
MLKDFMVKKILNYNKRNLVYHTSGDGPVILFIHGFGETSAVWKTVVKSFYNCKVIVPDLPGSGESDNYFLGMEAYANLMFLLMESEKMKGDERINIIGHSMGGYIALQMAMLQPEKIESLCLFHSSMFADNAEKVESRKKGIDFIKKNGSYLFLKNSIPDLFSSKSQRTLKAEIQKLVESARLFSPEVLVNYYEMMMSRMDRTSFMSNVDFPVLLIAGEEDNAVPLNHLLKQSYIAPITQLAILKDVAHMGMLECPVNCIEVIKSFLARFIG